MAARFRKTFRPDLLSQGSESEVWEEIEHYIEFRAKELEAQGLSPEDARQAALDAFGDPEAVASRVRQQDRRWASRNGWRETMGSIRQDFQQAFTGFRRNPAFALVASLTLAIGIGANTAIFSVMDGALIRGLRRWELREGHVHDAFRFEVEATDPATFGVVLALLMAVSLPADGERRGALPPTPTSSTIGIARPSWSISRDLPPFRPVWATTVKAPSS